MLLGSGVAVAGSIVWYDYSDRAAQTRVWDVDDFRYAKYQLNNDVKRIDWRWADPEFASQRVDRLEGRFRVLERDPSVKSVIVATHVPVFVEQTVIHTGDDPAGRSFFANLSAGTRIRSFSKVKHVVSWHTHRGSDVVSVRGSHGRSIHCKTIGSDYGKPEYVLLIDQLPERIRIMGYEGPNGK